MSIAKVYPGLDRVEREQDYHLGHYQVDLADGPLRFQLHGGICGEPHCLCDQVRIVWRTEGSTFHTWYTAEREWRDNQHRELDDGLLNVFRIVEDIDTFRERYGHLVYLRRKQVLQELGREGQSFQVKVPLDLLMPGADPEHQTLGSLEMPAGSGTSARVPFSIEFCSDPECYCNHQFVVVHQQSHETFCIDAQDTWSSVSGTRSAMALMAQVALQLKGSDAFNALLRFFRTERTLHNYHRYVSEYERRRIGT